MVIVEFKKLSFFIAKMSKGQKICSKNLIISWNKKLIDWIQGIKYNIPNFNKKSWKKQLNFCNILLKDIISIYKILLENNPMIEKIMIWLVDLLNYYAVIITIWINPRMKILKEV